MTAFPSLFSPIKLGAVTLKNRVFSPAHGTTLGTHDGLVSPDMIAYHAARARGGAGLIIIEGMNIHPTYHFPHMFLIADDDACIPGLTDLAQACHHYDCKVFGQLFHAGNAVRATVDGARGVAYAPSQTPHDRYKIVPAAMDTHMINEIISNHGDAARRFQQAGLDGVEIMASMGYLTSQFLNPTSNTRDDAYGGSFENRLRFLRECIADVRTKAGDNMVVGIRISGDEMTEAGLSARDVLEICQAIDADGQVDYFNVIAGSSADAGGWTHVFPPMAMEAGYVAPYAAAVKQAVSKPVLVAGRINQPHMAEQIIADGQADMCGMARALICDPDAPNKARAGTPDDIRACIGCNQACVGHRLNHEKISCIQHPESGRETLYDPLPVTQTPKTIMVVGGGPGGMKAACVAAERGHRVTLYEKSDRLGGQALLAQLLPGRTEFGGLITNLVHEMERAGVTVCTGTEVTEQLIAGATPDAVILATGATSYIPALEGADGAHVVDAWDVIQGDANVGQSVVVADWRCDWVGLGVAEKLARDGCQVQLCVNGTVAGEQIQGIVRDLWNGELHRLGVTVVPYASLFGADRTTTYFKHTITCEPIVLDGVDTVVTSHAYAPVNGLQTALSGFGGSVISIGDCLSPRTAEEAILDGLKAGCAV
jgi:2,4-dienoyl-CoA reductase-like NADH-dependent reductase (Old Yellow Enzyme family)